MIARRGQVPAAGVLRDRRTRPRPRRGPVLVPCASRSPRNKRKTWLLIFGTLVFVGAVGYVLGLVVSSGSTQAAITALAIALLISIGMSWTSYRYGDRIVLATVTREAGHPRGGATPAQRGGGPGARGGDPQAGRVHRPRAGAERVRHRPRPRALVHRGHAGAARHDEPRRARGRRRARDVPHPRPRHPAGDRRGHAGRRRGRCSPSSCCAGSGGAAWAAGATTRAAARATPSCSRSGWRWPSSRRSSRRSSSSRCRARREYLADAEGAMLTRYPPGLASALRKVAGDHTPHAHGEQRDRAPVAEPALPHAGRGEPLVGQPLFDPPAHSGAHPAS